MSKELKRSKCLENIAYITYRTNPNIENCGRYIKALRNSLSLVKDPNEKEKYEVLINKCLSTHLVYLQEAILCANKNNKNTTINFNTALKLKQLARSSYSINEGKYSLVNIEALKKLNAIKKSVILTDTLVLPCKVKSFNEQFKFNTQIIMSQDNVLGYTNGNYEFDNSKVNHYILINKIGEGIKNNPLLKKNTQPTL